MVWAGDLAINQDGSRFAYVTRRGDKAWVVDEGGATAFDLVLDGTLSFLRDGSWTCVAGNRDGRKLYVTVDGIEATRRFDWLEFGRLARRGAADASAVAPGSGELRSWVIAEAQLLLIEHQRP